MYIQKTTCGISAFVLACLVSACSDDTFTGNMLTGDEIGFCATVSHRPSGAARSCNAGGFEYLGPEAAQSDIDQQLYVHTLINEDCIDRPSTRAAVMTYADIKEFKVSAYAYSGGWNQPGATKLPNFMRDASVTPIGEGSVWSTDNKHYWPSTETNMRFFAYFNFPENAKLSGNRVTLNYTVDTDVTKQNDILAACNDVETADYIKSKGPVEMRFHHILTGIKFRTAKGDNALGDYKITKVGFYNVYGKGTFTLNPFTGDAEADRSKMWQISKGTNTSPMDFTIDLGDGIHAESNISITTDEQTMMMIPQVLPTGAYVEVTLKDKYGEEHTMTKNLAGKDWGMGQMITYVISSNAILVEDVFELYTVERPTATSAPQNEILRGNTYDYTAPATDYKLYVDAETNVSMMSYYLIRSYRKNYSYEDGKSDLTTEILDFSLNETPEKNTWIQLVPNTKGQNPPTEFGDGGYYDIKVNPQELTTIDPWSDVLQEMDVADVMPEGTADSEGYYDLSKRYNGKINTANCYIISAPGKYKFPAVYGNTIMDSKINYEAFGGYIETNNTSTGNTTSLVYMDDYPFYTANKEGDSYVAMKDLTSYDVSSNATTPSLIWSDCSDMVMPMSETLKSCNPHGDGSGFEELVLEDGTKMKVRYIKFEIKETDIQQCNMMMGYGNSTDGNKWSWHIWVTPFVPGNETINNATNTKLNAFKNQDKYKGIDFDFSINKSSTLTEGDYSYEMLPYNLGWCNHRYLKFGSTERTASFKFTQKGTNKTLTINVKQPTVTDTQYGTNLLYQWGRKDPMRGSYYFKNHKDPLLKPFFRLMGSTVQQYKIYNNQNQKTVSEVLRYPQYIYGANESYTDWNSKSSDYLWRIPDTVTIKTNNEEERYTRKTDGKTIYDPSPVRFCVPPADVFNSISGSFGTDKKLGLFSGTFCLPLGGYRDNKGELTGAGEEAIYHTSGLDMIRFDGANKTLPTTNRVNAGSIRPCIITKTPTSTGK